MRALCPAAAGMKKGQLALPFFRSWTSVRRGRHCFLSPRVLPDVSCCVLPDVPERVPVLPSVEVLSCFFACPGGMQPLSLFDSPGGQVLAPYWLPDALPLAEPEVVPAPEVEPECVPAVVPVPEVVPVPAVVPLPAVVPVPVPVPVPAVVPCCWRARRFEPGPYTFTELVLVAVRARTVHVHRVGIGVRVAVGAGRTRRAA
jgi:hypothetical protein